MYVGVDRSNSLKMWLEYFPNAFIYGIDISGKPFIHVCVRIGAMYLCMYVCIAVSDVGPRHKIFQADQSNKEQMKHIAESEILYGTYIHTYIHTVHTCYVHAYIHLVRTYIHKYIYTYIHPLIKVYIHTVHTYIHTYIHTSYIHT